MVPRVIFEGWTKGAWERVAGNTKRLTKVLVDACQQYNFDGLVLELWTQSLSVGAPASWLVKIIKKLGNQMKDEGLDLFLVVPPVSYLQ